MEKGLIFFALLLKNKGKGKQGICDWERKRENSDAVLYGNMSALIW